ncbi:tetratricopeptide repeat protein [Kribbella sp. NPDC000426]|uniref:tetratricopeptide repeat protein n=1 Tax=Kribbella sp. NPDC000426 TaxID=3154255 RepID=UPI00332F93FB
MTPEVPPRKPRLPRTEVTESVTTIVSDRSRSGTMQERYIRIWAKVEQARADFRAGRLPDPVSTARRLLEEVEAAWPTRQAADQNQQAMLGTAAFLLAAALRDQGDEAQARRYFEQAVTAFERAPESTDIRGDLAADQGSALLALGRAEEAVQVLRRALDDLGESLPVVRRNLAAALAASGREEEAIDLLAAGVVRGTFDPATHHLLATLLDQAGRPAAVREKAWTDAAEALLAAEEIDQAIDAGRRAVEANPSGPSLAALGRSYAAAGWYDEAAAALRESDGFNASAWTRLNLADVLAALGDLDGTADAALAAVALSTDGSVLTKAAAHLFDAGRFDELDGVLETLAPTDPGLAVNLRGLAALRRGQRDEALALLRAGVSQLPDDTSMLWDVAVALYDLGEFELAIDVLRRVQELDATDVLALAQIGVLEGELERYDEAERDLRAALDEIDDPSTHAYLGRLLSLTDRPAEALEHLQIAVDQGYSGPWTLTDYGLALKDAGQNKEAEKFLRQSLELEPEQPNALLTLSAILLDRGDAAANTEGGELAQRLLAFDPASASGLGILGEVRRREGRYDEAVEHFERAVEMSPEWAWALGSYGQALRERYDQRGAPDDAALTRAADLLQRALEIEADETFLRAELALVRTRQDKYDEAVELLDRARELDPQPALTIPLATALRGRFLNSVAPGNQDDLVRAERILIGELAAATAAEVQDDAFVAGLNGELAEVLALLGRPDHAHQKFKLASKFDPEVAYYRVRRGQLYADAGDLKRALRCYEQAMELEPDYPDLRVLQADALVKLHDSPAARAVLDEALAVKPDDESARFKRYQVLWEAERIAESVRDLELLAESPDVLAARGEALRLQGRYDEALALLNRVLSDEPGHQSALATTGTVRLAQGDLDGARSALEQAVAANPAEPYAQGRLADLDFTYGDAERALSRLKVQLEDQPDPGLRGVYVDVLTKLERWEEAESCIESALWDDADNPLFVARLGWVLLETDRTEEGMRNLQRAVDLQGDLLTPLVDLAYGELRAGRPEEADAAAVRATEAAADEPGGWLARARIAMTVGDFRTAVETGRRAASCWYQVSSVYDQLGWALRYWPENAAGDRVATYDAGLRLDALDPWMMAGRADALRRMGDSDGSGETYERTLSLLRLRTGADANVFGLQGWCLFQLGRYDEATNAYLRRLSWPARTASPLFELALMAAVSDRRSEAESFLERAVQETAREHPAVRNGIVAVAANEAEHERARLSDDVWQSLQHAFARASESARRPAGA